MFERNWYEGHVREDCTTRCEVQMNFPIHVTDPDKGLNSEFAISLQGDGSELFSIMSNGKVVLREKVDRETKDLYSMMVVAKDRGN
jgi:hypothetical protein